MVELENALRVIKLSKEKLYECSSKEEQIKIVKKYARKRISSVHPDVNSKNNTKKVANANTRLVLDARNRVIEAIQNGMIPTVGEKTNLDEDVFSAIENIFKESEIEKAVRAFSQKKTKRGIEEDTPAKKFRTRIKKSWNENVEKMNKKYYDSKNRPKGEDEPER